MILLKQITLKFAIDNYILLKDAYITQKLENKSGNVLIKIMKKSTSNPSLSH